MVLLIAHEVLALVLLYTCFCRALKTDHCTRRSILLAFWMLSIAAVTCVFAPLAFSWQPDGVTLLLLASVVVVQVVTSFHWRGGAPRDFQEA